MKRMKKKNKMAAFLAAVNIDDHERMPGCIRRRNSRYRHGQTGISDH